MPWRTSGCAWCTSNYGSTCTPANLKYLDASLPTLRRHAANIVLARRRSEAHHVGRYYIPGAIVYTYDPLHLFHNFVQSLLKQLKDKGTEDPGGERVLVLDHLIEAAESLGDKLVLDILHGAFDWNSHACSSLVLDKPKLVAAMLEKGYVREAKALEVIGGAWVAWCKPHSTEADRTRKLRLLGVFMRTGF